MTHERWMGGDMTPRPMKDPKRREELRQFLIDTLRERGTTRSWMSYSYPEEGDEAGYAQSGISYADIIRWFPRVEIALFSKSGGTARCVIGRERWQMIIGGAFFEEKKMSIFKRELDEFVSITKSVRLKYIQLIGDDDEPYYGID